jgi:hypothetical protein
MPWLVLAACGDSVFACTDDAACDEGFCEPSGYCSFPDADCASGRRYGPLAADGYSGKCVTLEEATSATDATTSPGPTTLDTTTPNTTTTTDATQGEATSPGVTTMQVTTDPMSEVTTDPTDPVDPTDDASTGAPSETTGMPVQQVTVSFGDRDDADFQNVVEDTSLVSYATAQNMGTHADLHLNGNDFGAWEVAVMRFDVSALPDDVQLVDVTLRLSSMDLVDPGAVQIHALTEDWIEGEVNQLPGVCNWIDRLPDTPWTTEGAGDGSYDPAELGVVVFDQPFAPFDISLPIELVELWRVAPSENFGLLLRTTNVAEPVYIPSSEARDESLRPLLLVTYQQ